MGIRTRLAIIAYHLIMVSIEGPVEEAEGKLVLRIPMEDGGTELAEFAEGIGRVEDGYLVVVIPPWLALQMQIGAGSLVVVDNAEGKFRMTRADRE